MRTTDTRNYWMEQIHKYCKDLLIEIFNYDVVKVVVSLPEREEDIKEHNKKLARDEHEMNEVFKRKVEVKSERLKDLEVNLNRSLMAEMERIEKEKKELIELRDKFLKERKVLKHLGFS